MVTPKSGGWFSVEKPILDCYTITWYEFKVQRDKSAMGPGWVSLHEHQEYPQLACPQKTLIGAYGFTYIYILLTFWIVKLGLVELVRFSKLEI